MTTWCAHVVHTWCTPCSSCCCCTLCCCTLCAAGRPISRVFLLLHTLRRGFPTWWSRGLWERRTLGHRVAGERLPGAHPRPYSSTQLDMGGGGHRGCDIWSDPSGDEGLHILSVPRCVCGTAYVEGPRPHFPQPKSRNLSHPDVGLRQRRDLETNPRTVSPIPLIEAWGFWAKVAACFVRLQPA